MYSFRFLLLFDGRKLPNETYVNIVCWPSEGLLKMIICKKARKAFSLHKQSAKGRHIKFLFSLEGWCLWWAQHLGPNWLELRGTTSGQYVMGRIGDKGPYAS